MRIKRDTKRTPKSSTNGVKNTGGARYNCDDSKNPRKEFKMMPVDQSNDERKAAPNQRESLSWVSLPGKSKKSGRMKMACRTWIKPQHVGETVPVLLLASQMRYNSLITVSLRTLSSGSSIA